MCWKLFILVGPASVLSTFLHTERWPLLSERPNLLCMGSVVASIGVSKKLWKKNELLLHKNFILLWTDFSVCQSMLFMKNLWHPPSPEQECPGRFVSSRGTTSLSPSFLGSRPHKLECSSSCVNYSHNDGPFCVLTDFHTVTWIQVGWGQEASQREALISYGFVKIEPTDLWPHEGECGLTWVVF